LVQIQPLLRRQALIHFRPAMTVPVQTWGAMGNLVAEQREFGQSASRYLDQHEVYDLFAHLLKQVAIAQPANPIEFLKKELATPPPLTVCVLGPPGVHRSEYCAQLEKSYKCQHIQVGKLLKANAETKEQASAGYLVDDAVVIKLVKGEIDKCVQQKKGWVLDGYPRTKVQAQALSSQENGICLDKVILLHPVEESQRSDVRMQEYQRHVASVVEFFKNVVRKVQVPPGNNFCEATFTTIKNNLHVREHGSASLRTHRFAVVGCCGSGRSTQSAMLAQQYGVVHVNVARLVRKHQETHGLKADGCPPEWMSDEDLCHIVGNRLAQIDCLRKGWVLDGFPTNAAQAEFLRQAHHWPSHVFNCMIPKELCDQRMEARKVDPVTGNAYYSKVNDPDVSNRLIRADYDSMDQVFARFDLHKTNVDKLMIVLQRTCTIPCAANKDAQTVFKAIRAKIDTGSGNVSLD